jgi:uncharacterized protein
VAGAIVHFEIAGEDPAELSEFYDDIFGWGSNEWLPSYFGATTGEGSPDGAISAPPEGQTKGVVIYVEVPSIDDALARIEAAGGTTKVPRTEIPDTVVYAQFLDPAGNVMGLVEAQRPG